MREAIARLSKLQTEATRAALLQRRDTQCYPDGTLQVPVPTLEKAIRDTYPKRSFDFSSADPNAGADAQEGSSTLRANGVDSQQIAIADIQTHLKDGPVLVSAYDSGHSHAELIMSINKDGTYNVYNPLVSGGKGTLDPKNIIVRQFPRAYALKPVEIQNVGPSPTTKKSLNRHHPQ